VPDGGSGRPKELRCGDFLDNDGDNLQDCLDPDCAQQDCSAAGSPGCRCDPCPNGICPQGELKCEDGIDNDGDGLADCADTDCDGLRCQGTDGCVCTRGRATEAAGACGDGIDNDHDGKPDCEDPDCDTLSCGPGCACALPLATELATHCGDADDNDRDGLTDCADPDCAGDSCGAGCACDNLLPTETAASCGDVADNDDDGQTDCADLDCTGDSCGTGCLCVAEGGVGRASEVTCGDRDAAGAVDNDGDGLANCADADCAGLGCGTGVAPVDVTDCVCVGTVPTEMDCGNGADDDLDGLADCADRDDCANKAPCPAITAVVPLDGPSRPANPAICGTAHPRQALAILGERLGVDASGAYVGTVAGVTIGGVACLNVVPISATELHCESPVHEAGRVEVTVTNTGNFPGTLANGYAFTTGQGSTIDGCRTDTLNLTAAPGLPTPAILGRVFEFDVTDAVPPANPYLAQVGYGPAGSNAECDPAWTWIAATADSSPEPSPYDHYRATFTLPEGTYAFQYRFSEDGVHWLYCDADTSTAGVQTGTLTVAP
jgi:hypothetical protein